MARYAPSPTGPLHLGNLQTALASWLQARLNGMGFILRIEDLDRARCNVRWVESLVADLYWLGIDWDIGPGVSAPGEYVQSERIHLYKEALARLAELGLLYPCICSRKDLRELASAPHGPLGSIYPGTCKNRTLPSGVFHWLQDTPNSSIRLRNPPENLSFDDQVLGGQRCRTATDIGDFVVYRRDGVFAYHLAVVIDDIDMGVGDIVRGADLLWSTFPQQSLYNLLDAKPPVYWHTPLLLDEAGRRLAKRDRATSLRFLIEDGATPQGIVGMLASNLGLVPEGAALSLRELLDSQTIESFTQALRGVSQQQRQSGLGRQE